MTGLYFFSAAKASPPLARSQHFPPENLLPGLAAGHRAPSAGSTSARSQQKRQKTLWPGRVCPALLQKGASKDRRPSTDS